MKIGTQLQVPRGYRGLQKNTDYYLLRSDPISEIVSLIMFSKIQRGHAAHLLTIPREDFEQGLINLEIIKSPVQRELPPWLSEFEGLNMDLLDLKREGSKKSYLEMVTDRYLIISVALSRRQEILASNNPNHLLNQISKELPGKQNPTRFKQWFYTYTLFSDNIWSLLPTYHNVGKWDRSGISGEQRCGRRSLEGRKALFHADEEMKVKIAKGFAQHSNPSLSRRAIYQKVIESEFGCKAVRNNLGEIVYIQPQSKPFPSQDQFNYWVERNFSQEKLKKATRGAYGARAQAGHIGKFSEGLMNLYEDIECDGYYFVDKLTALDGVTPIPGFCVIRIVCSVSGAILGIGFAKGAESLEAYEMALFSMAIEKKDFFRLFGYLGKPEEWPCEGLSTSVITDRGPFASINVEKHSSWLNSFETTPAYSGQSKATSESSHPRLKKIIQAPSYFQSSKNYVQMAKAEITKALEDNHTSDASGRMVEEMWDAEFTPTPHNIWVYMNDIGRTSARSIKFNQAVRLFLKQKDVVIRRDGVYLLEQNYYSEELASTGVFNRIVRNGVIQTKAYVMNMCVRYIWLEVDGRIYELAARYSIRTVNEDSYISIYELEDRVPKISRSKAKLRNERPAISAYFQQQFEESTGIEWDAGQEKKGRHKRTEKVRSAESEQRRIL